MLLLPLPCMLEELFAADIFLAYALLFQLGHDLALRGDGSVVGAGNPARVLAVHARLADKHVVERVVEHVTHVKDTRHVRWRNHYCIGLTGIRFGMEEAVMDPVGIPLVFYLCGIVLRG